MPQKEDILEQIVEEYLTHKGYFVQRNIKYRPDKNSADYDSRKDSVHSDIDVLGYNPREIGAKRVRAFTIKSYQGGFDFGATIRKIDNNEDVNGKNSRLRYRELCIPKWTNAFIKEIARRTGESRFTYVLAITKQRGRDDAHVWTKHRPFVAALRNNPIEVLTLKQMVEEIDSDVTTTPAATDIGRTLQLFRAAGLRPKPAKPEQSIESDDEVEAGV